VTTDLVAGNAYGDYSGQIRNLRRWLLNYNVAVNLDRYEKSEEMVTELQSGGRSGLI